MAKSPNAAAAAAAVPGEKTSSASASTRIITKDLPQEFVNYIIEFFSDTEIHGKCSNYNCNDLYSDLMLHILKPHIIQRGRVSCTASVSPAVTNGYNGLHGGAVAAIAERVSVACARTIVNDDKELFLGELSMSYLSAAQQNEVLVVDGFVVRSGRNLTVATTEFKIKKTGKLVYMARATFYHIPVAKL